MLPATNKSLGQHWLSDDLKLNSIIADAQLAPTDTVIEIGPGPGSLTDKIIPRVNKLIAIEFDNKLATSLKRKHTLNSKVSVVNEDILKFNFASIVGSYKIVANIPYYLTSNLIRILSDIINPPTRATLLVQQEVAERINASVGDMSKLSVFTQNIFETEVGTIVEARYFEPPPKVNSQVIILKLRAKPLVGRAIFPIFQQVVKAGFSEKRKKLRSSLSGGLHLTKAEVDQLLEKADIKNDARAQELNISDWVKIATNYKK